MRFLTVAVFAWAALVQAALACKQEPDEVFETLPMREWVIASAKVASVAPLPFRDGIACVALGYDLIAPLVGDPGEHFAVKFCDTAVAPMGETPEARVQELQRWLVEQTGYGLSVGETALVGLIRLSDDETPFRFAVPNCWGPFSVGLDELTQQEKDRFRDDIAEMVQRGE